MRTIIDYSIVIVYLFSEVRKSSSKMSNNWLIKVYLNCKLLDGHIFFLFLFVNQTPIDNNDQGVDYNAQGGLLFCCPLPGHLPESTQREWNFCKSSKGQTTHESWLSRNGRYVSNYSKWFEAVVVVGIASECFVFVTTRVMTTRTTTTTTTIQLKRFAIGMRKVCLCVFNCWWF